MLHIYKQYKQGSCLNSQFCSSLVVFCLPGYALPLTWLTSLTIWQKFNTWVFFFSGPSKLTVVISWQFPISQHKTGINSEHPQHVFTNLTAKWYFCLLLVPVVVGRNQSGFWQQIWKEKSKVIQLMHNWGKCRWMQSKGDMQGDLWKGCKRTQWHKSMAGHPGFQDSQPLDVRRPSDGHRPTETGAKGGTPKFIY